MVGWYNNNQYRWLCLSRQCRLIPRNGFEIDIGATCCFLPCHAIVYTASTQLLAHSQRHLARRLTRRAVPRARTRRDASARLARSLTTMRVHAQRAVQCSRVRSVRNERVAVPPGAVLILMCACVVFGIHYCQFRQRPLIQQMMRVV